MSRAAIERPSSHKVFNFGARFSVLANEQEGLAAEAGCAIMAGKSRRLRTREGASS
jgi:hypothetical protein